MLRLIILVCLMVQMYHGTTVPFPEKFSTNYHQQDVFTDYRIITYSDLIDDDTVSSFFDREVESYSNLLIDPVRQQVIVGAMNHLLRLDLTDLHLLEKVSWFPSNTTHSTCQTKGKPTSTCNNYIRVLVAKEKQIFACGTNAFSPRCSWRSISKLSSVTEEVSGVGSCPYDPLSNNTALLSHDGSLYVGTEMDYVGRDPAIYRILGPSPKLRTVRRNLKWLNEPDFISSYEIGEYIYFFFREDSLENICSQGAFSRVARICKHDKGGNFLLRDNWTSFLKARIACSQSTNRTAFHYDELQGTYFDHHKKILYATFSTARPNLHGSAVCIYNISDIDQVFSGPFLYQARNDDTWTVQENNQVNQNQCSDSHSSDSATALMNAQRYQLMQEVIQPLHLQLFYQQPEQRWNQIVADSVYLHHSRQHVSVVFVATLEGAIHKIMALSPTQSCLLEVIYVTPIGDQTVINTMHIIKEKHVLLVGTGDEVLRIPVQRCRRFKSQRSCLMSMDPYCGWDTRTSACTTAPLETPRHHWHQNVMSCPLLDSGASDDWSAWSQWRPCTHANTETHTHQPSTVTDVCVCRNRICRRSDDLCEGHDTQVKNCTVHGTWSEWGDWSACSSSCGSALQERSRSCTNPSPQHGGRICVGTTKQERQCDYVPCIEPRIAAPEIDGGWSEWMEWSGCSRRCGGGIKKRYRLCNQPPPSRDGKMCPGNSEQWSSCNTRMCEEQRRSSSWTDWMKTNITDKGYTEQRFKCVCKASVPEERLIRTDVRFDTRYCAEEGRCKDPGVRRALWSAWSSWGSCKGGVRWRHRSCDTSGSQCLGSSEQRQDCPMDRGQWSCWSDYSSCSMSCGEGLKVRQRTCQSTTDGRSYNVECSGNGIEEQPCVMPACTVNRGWDNWSLWSFCQSNNLQQRKRECATKPKGALDCKGPDRETRMCNYDPAVDSPTILMTQSGRPADLRIYHVIIVGILSFLLGGFVFVMFLIYCKRPTRTPVVIANEPNGYPPAYAPAYDNDLKYDQSKAAPNEYMSHAQLSPTSSAGKYNQRVESPVRNETQNSFNNPPNGSHFQADIIRDPYPYRNTRSRQQRHQRDSRNNLNRSPSTYSASSPHSPGGYSSSGSVHSPVYAPLTHHSSFYDGSSPTHSTSPVSPSFSTMSLSRYRDPSKMTVKEATMHRNNLIRHSSLLKQNKSIDDR